MARADVYIAVFLVSLSSLAFEVLLTRFFSIAQWNHLSFMVIGIALFGFGASGAFLSVLDAKKKGWEKALARRRSMCVLMLFYTVASVAAFLVLNALPLDYFRLFSEPIQVFYLLCAYIALSIPFFLTGIVVSTGFAALPSRSGLVYFSTMSGSALGALAPLPLLPFMEEGVLAVLFSAVPLLFFISLWVDRAGEANKKRTILFAVGASALAAVFFLCFSENGEKVKVNPSPYKALSQALKFPGSEVVRSVSDIRGRIDRLESPYLRFAPGLSLRFHERLPKQSAMYLDADSPFMLYDVSSPADAEFAAFSLPFAAYAATSELSNVLVIQKGGGSAIAAAIASGSENITVVERHPVLAENLREHYRLRVVDEIPGTYLAKSKERFSLIQIERWGASLPGAAALEQDRLTTVDSFTTYLESLAEDGLLAVSGKLVLPPANVPRLWAAAYEALKAVGKKNPSEHLAVLRNWDVFTLIVSGSPFENTYSLEKFATRLNFDLVYLPGIDENLANKYNVFERPFYFREILKLKKAYDEGRESEYFEDYILDVRPQGDDRPFPNRYLKWTRLGDLYRVTGSRPTGFLLSGELVVAAVFAEALFVALFLLISPVLIASGKGEKPRFSSTMFFIGVGAGFMLAELFFIKHFTALFASPAIAFTVVLSGMLVFSGAGGLLSQKMGACALKRCLFALVSYFVVLYAWLLPAIEKMLAFSVPVRCFFAYSLLVPSGLLLGIPFSLGMRLIPKTARDRAYAWAANGCASVLASIAAAQIALGAGIPAMALCAGTAYFLAFSACLPQKRNLT